MTRCSYCNDSFANKSELEKHVINLLLCGESDRFCWLMIKQVHLTKWLSKI